MDLPINTLIKAKGKRIVAKLKNGTEYKGKLEISDSFMNLSLSEVEETTEESTIGYPKAFVKGNNILYVKIS